MSEVYTPTDLTNLNNQLPLYGVIGSPIAHSLSPFMQSAAFLAHGLPAKYIRIEVAPEALASAMIIFKQHPLLGWNCTIPHKIELLSLMDELGESARQLGAVNTVINQDGHLTGFNTDGQGWVRAIREDFSLDVRDLRILILGLGGAGQAIAKQACLENCERLVLVNRNADKAQALLTELKKNLPPHTLLRTEERLKTIPWDEQLISEELNTIDLIINASSLGLKTTDASPLSMRSFQPHLCVYDTIYQPTQLLNYAQAAGCRSSNGLSMLLHQGALSFELWTGKPAPLEAMRSALQKAYLAK